MIKQACRNRWVVAKKCERGLVSLQAALVFPVLMGVMLFAAQLVLVVIADRSVSAIAEHAADAAALHDGRVSYGRQAADDASSQMAGIRDITTQINVDTQKVAVTVEAKPVQLLPLNIKVTAQATAPLEKVFTFEERQ